MKRIVVCLCLVWIAWLSHVNGFADGLTEEHAAMVGKVRREIERYRKEIAVPAGRVVLPGLDVLIADKFKVLDGKKVGVISNHTGLALDGTPIVEVLHAAPNVTLTTIFAPEHGFAGKIEGHVDDAVDAGTKITIHSLHGKTRRPTPESLENVEILVFDIQDVGARFYTYITTMLFCMEEAAKRKIRFVVLDRPNPIRGDIVEGPVSEKAKNSFVSCHPIALRHGMTVGELAVLFNIELNLGLDLHVVPCLGWKRSMDFEATRLPWVNPSPNMRSLTAEYLYTGTCLAESSNFSMGRGTDLPFEWVGAPWTEAETFVAALRRNAEQAGLEGVRMEPCRFVPDASRFKEEECFGVRFVPENREKLRAVRMGIVLLTTLRKEYPEKWNARFSTLMANSKTEKMILDGAEAGAVERAWQEELDRFLQRREGALLYD